MSSVKIRLDPIGHKSSVTVNGKELPCSAIDVHTDVKGRTTATLAVHPDVVETVLPSGSVEVKVVDPFTGDVMVTHAQMPDKVPQSGEWWRFRNDPNDDWDYMRIFDDGRFPKSMYREECTHSSRCGVDARGCVEDCAFAALQRDQGDA